MKTEFNVKLDKSRTLKFTNRAAFELEAELGMPVVEFLSKGGEGLGVREITKIVWAGLLHSDPSLTVDQVVDMIPLSNYASVAEVAFKALTAGFGIDLEAQQANGAAAGDQGNAKAGSGIGKSSKK